MPFETCRPLDPYTIDSFNKSKRFRVDNLTHHLPSCRYFAPNPRSNRWYVTLNQDSMNIRYSLLVFGWIGFVHLKKVFKLDTSGFKAFSTHLHSNALSLFSKSIMFKPPIFLFFTTIYPIDFGLCVVIPPTP